MYCYDVKHVLYCYDVKRDGGIRQETVKDTVDDKSRMPTFCLGHSKERKENRTAKNGFPKRGIVDANSQSVAERTAILGTQANSNYRELVRFQM